MNSEKTILLTIDVEDWFQVENFRPWIPFETWGQQELRVEKNTHRLLDLFDSIEMQPANFPISKPQADDYELSFVSNQLKNDGQPTTNNAHTKKVKANFFVLGWIAERLPHLVREIQSRGHEVASHGYNHNLCNQQSTFDLKKELTESKKLLEDITGSPVLGFRAPNFSVNDEVLKTIEDCGYLYDSSYNSFSLHDRYGTISLNGQAKKGIAHKLSDNFFELPISNLCFRNPMSYLLSATSLKRKDRDRFVLPWGGGAYFRLMPLPVFTAGVKNILKEKNAHLFYLHPWEVDAEQPKVAVASYLNKIKHYTNVRQTEMKLKKLIKNLSHCRFITCSRYLELSA